MAIWINIAIAVIAFCVAVGYRYYNPSAKNDNIIEQAAEMVIKEEVGFNIDISPEGKE